MQLISCSAMELLDSFHRTSIGGLHYSLRDYTVFSAVSKQKSVSLVVLVYWLTTVHTQWAIIQCLWCTASLAQPFSPAVLALNKNILVLQHDKRTVARQPLFVHLDDDLNLNGGSK